MELMDGKRDGSHATQNGSQHNGSHNQRNRSQDMRNSLDGKPNSSERRDTRQTGIDLLSTSSTRQKLMFAGGGKATWQTERFTRQTEWFTRQNGTIHTTN